MRGRNNALCSAEQGNFDIEKDNVRFTEEIPVVWDEKALSAVRLGSAGTYEVPGQAVVKEYDAPLVRGVADPVIRRIVLPGNRFFCAVPAMRGIASIPRWTKAPTSSSTTGNCF